MNTPSAAKPKTSIVVMGVAGSGKSTVGRILAHRLGWSFAEGDDFHSAANVAKMAAGTPLTDDDRRPWLPAAPPPPMTTHGRGSGPSARGSTPTEPIRS